MGEVVCADKRLLNALDSMRNRSSTLNNILTTILASGSITILLTSDAFNLYENRTIVLGLSQNHMQNKASVESELIMEICNAWHDVIGKKPDPKGYNNAEAYGEAVEHQEWEAVQQHVEIYREIGGASRFKQAFDDPAQNWNEFGNYLKYQRKEGHTKKIESHWKPH